jgi:DNA-binding MarR family transcriptional regulator
MTHPTQSGTERVELSLDQRKTLQEARRLQDGFTGSFEAADLSHIVGVRHVSTDKARRRLNRLADLGYLEADRSTPHRVFYTLTEQGREAIVDG